MIWREAKRERGMQLSTGCRYLYYGIFFEKSYKFEKMSWISIEKTPYIKEHRAKIHQAVISHFSLLVKFFYWKFLFKFNKVEQEWPSWGLGCCIFWPAFGLWWTQTLVKTNNICWQPKDKHHLCCQRDANMLETGSHAHKRGPVCNIFDSYLLWELSYHKSLL